ncbi:hypothetical protein EW146_g4656 [Bondarzewia mesenterica]|uniref:3',5'-cyclic-nucleotide phosphodiesterase n=1 Tax=Bondarzewia mesenterica TaxID=1095465 RepID=A0A4S4LU07_9AGAM|nr:hypothetical protein EW146_g4656 [Bondarzewia mesenterica]
MPTFDLVVVGCGGGPFESNLSAYLLKPCDAVWEDGIIALEAGSGLGTLNQIMKQHPGLFNDSKDPLKPSRFSAYQIYSLIRCFLITHAHLDHVTGLVLSAGCLKGPRKRIHAARHVIENLEAVFSDRIWPKLASWSEKDDDHKLLYDPLKFTKTYRKIFRDVSVRMMPVTHGRNITTGVYESTAFFLRHDPSGQEFLFFGDVEPDSVSSRPFTLATWKAAAPKIPATLSALFIECSWPSGRSDELLYGHLCPEHLADELAALAMEVVRTRGSHKQAVTEEMGGASSNSRRKSERKSKDDSATEPKRKRQRPNPVEPEALRDALKGLRVYIIHCKDDLEGKYDRPIQRVVADQVRALVDAKGLGAEILSVEQGTHIGMLTKKFRCSDLKLCLHSDFFDSISTDICRADIIIAMPIVSFTTRPPQVIAHTKNMNVVKVYIIMCARFMPGGRRPGVEELDYDLRSGSVPPAEAGRKFKLYQLNSFENVSDDQEKKNNKTARYWEEKKMIF